MSWKASRRPEGFQMHIDAPDAVSGPETPEMTISANIFNALPTAEVIMKIGVSGDWIRMERKRVTDPARLAVAERESALGEVPWRNLGNASVSEHLWVAEPGRVIDPGVHVIHVRAVDDWHEYEGRRLIYVR